MVSYCSGPRCQCQTNGDITIFVNNVAVKIDDATNIATEPSGTNNVYFGESDYSGHDDFDGQIDEVRMVNYEKRAFAGGLMISKIVSKYKLSYNLQ